MSGPWFSTFRPRPSRRLLVLALDPDESRNALGFDQLIPGRHQRDGVRKEGRLAVNAALSPSDRRNPYLRRRVGMLSILKYPPRFRTSTIRNARTRPTRTTARAVLDLLSRREIPPRCRIPLPAGKRVSERLCLPAHLFVSMFPPPTICDYFLGLGYELFLITVIFLDLLAQTPARRPNRRHLVQFLGEPLRKSMSSLTLALRLSSAWFRTPAMFWNSSPLRRRTVLV